MTIKITMSTPEIEISNNAKICYANKTDKDITHELVHGHSHLAALRFAYASIELKSISIACQNQIVRSKHLDFMVQSKRYVSLKKGEFSFIMPKNITSAQMDAMTISWEYALGMYENLINDGVKKEDARAILPMNTSTDMNITGSLQGWWDFFRLRMNKRAQLEIREVAIEIFNQLSTIYPKVFSEQAKIKMLNGEY